MNPQWPDIDPSVFKAFSLGQQDAFRHIYDAWTPFLIPYAARICGSIEAAEDVVQDVFVHLWEKRTELQAATAPNYIVRLCKNLAINVFRKNVRRMQFSSTFPFNTEPADTLLLEGVHPLIEKESAILKAIESLPAARKKIFLLSRKENKTYREIAEEMNISIKTVENQVSQALKQLRNKIDLTTIILVILYYLIVNQ